MNAVQCREAGKINKSVVGKLAYKYKNQNAGYAHLYFKLSLQSKTTKITYVGGSC